MLAAVPNFRWGAAYLLYKKLHELLQVERKYEWQNS
jgi:hypothetical protein